ncbi:phage regulatory CII family protein [Zoogloea sp.]|uniref:phage regulatory CII family protein n=1 Tax=Zoogloea sp. TaxID=49181 RepID=UPI001415CB11|nr:MAG: hypothetical protein F9K15_12880 [Zoogloea sp.]
MKHHSNPSFRHDDELIGTLIYVFITQKRYDILKLSQQLGMEYADLYAFVSGRRTMPITLLRRITEITGDKIFFDTVFGGSNITWGFRKNKHAHSGNPSQEALESVEAVGEMCRAVKNAMVDGKVSETERAEIIHRIAFVQQELADLLDAVKVSE